MKEDIVLPLAWPVKSADGKKDITAIPLKKGTQLIVSIFNANRSARIWGPDADQWKPERWLKQSSDVSTGTNLPGVYASM